MNSHKAAGLSAACTLCLAFAAPAAIAQSNLEIVGNIDVGVSKSNAGTSINPGVVAPNVWSVQQGASSTLRFRGREDLGGGLYARFQLTHRFLPDTGTPFVASAFWFGDSIVAVGDTKLGEVYAGRDIIPAWWLAFKADPTYYQYVSQLGLPYTFANFTLSAATDASSVRRSNTVGYRSPKLNGFSAQVAVAAGEAVRKRTVGFNAVYDKNGLYAGIGYDGADGDNRVWLATLGYELVPGLVAVLHGAQARGGLVAGYEGKSLSLSLTWNVGVHRPYVQLAHLKTNAATANSSTKVGLGEEYFLSKRTSLYASGGFAKTADRTRSNAVDFGVNHRF